MKKSNSSKLNTTSQNCKFMNFLDFIKNLTLKMSLRNKKDIQNRDIHSKSSVYQAARNINISNIGSSNDQPRTKVGILNRGKKNKFINNKFVGLDVGIDDQGEDTEAAGNKFE